MKTLNFNANKLNMDEQINRAILPDFGNENIEVRRTQLQGVLRSVENGNLQFMGMQSRDQEYIDHTLLGPEYITNTISNNFIIDLIEQDSPGQTVSDCPINSLGNNESFPSEAQLHTILQFVNRQGHIKSQTNVNAESSNEHLVHASDKEILDSEFLAMHGNLLNEPNFKIFCSQQSIPSQEALNTDLSVSALENIPVQSEKEKYQESLTEIPDVEVVGPVAATAKKVLPHKKRISKKLKNMERPESLYQIEPDNSPQISSLAVVTNGTHFECELCGVISESQVKFFSHLKGHYEPTLNIETKTLNENVQPLSIEIADVPSSIEARTPSTVVTHADNVFNEVELNFENFSEVVGLSAQHQVSVDTTDTNDMKILSSNVIEKCMEYVVQTQEPSQSCNVREEVEFSDTEDMLEGIRGVVDKVSVDDTCDDLEMPPNDISKEQWFTSSALSFKDHTSFQKITELMPIQPIATQNNEIKTENEAMSTHQYNSEFNNIRHDVESSIDQNEEVDFQDSSNYSDEKRKRGRPKGSKKKISSSDIKIEHESADEMEENNKKRHICEKCHREFNSSNALKYHDLSHTGKRPHQCDICGKSFFAQSALKSHLRLHTGDKPYECPQCERKFRQWSDLKYHITSIHSDEKNFQCEFCGKSFSRKYSLVIHRRIHTSERNYKCEFCPKAFRASSYLQNHRKIHTGEKPYTCQICGKKFRVSGDLRRHGRTHERKAALNQKINTGEKKVNLSKQSENSHHHRSEDLLKTEYPKESKEDLLFLDKMASKIDHLFKTEEVFVNTDIENTDLSFET